MKVNVGCGEWPLEGYVNIDLVDEHADVQADFLELTYTDVDEIVFSHTLEHIPRPTTQRALKHLLSWLRPGGSLVVEVPDMEVILALGTGHPDWVGWIYGQQIHRGEVHFNGFTAFTLMEQLIEAGFVVEAYKLRRFLSTHPSRQDFPCIEAVAVRPG